MPIRRDTFCIHADRERGPDRIEVVEGTAIAPAHQVAALALLEDLERSLDGAPQRSLADPVALLALADEDVVEVGPDGGGDVRGHRPRSRGPDEEPLAGSVDER